MKSYYQGVDIKDIKNDSGRDVILAAAWGEHNHTIDFLDQEYGMRPTKKAYIIAKEYGMKDTMEHLKEKYGLGKERGREVKTYPKKKSAKEAILAAARKGENEQIKLLKEAHFPDIKLRDIKFKPSLSVADIKIP